MRVPSDFASFIGIMSHAALPQAVAERDALVKDKTFAAPAAFGFRHALEVFEDAALEMIDLAKPRASK